MADLQGMGLVPHRSHSEPYEGPETSVEDFPVSGFLQRLEETLNENRNLMTRLEEFVYGPAMAEEALQDVKFDNLSLNGKLNYLNERAMDSNRNLRSILRRLIGEDGD